jgi:hypothetical protein
MVPGCQGAESGSCARVEIAPGSLRMSASRCSARASAFRAACSSRGRFCIRAAMARLRSRSAIASSCSSADAAIPSPFL